MSFFSPSQNYLGIDFDSNSVKVVELKNEGGRPQLVTYGYIDQEMDKASGKKDDGDDSQTAQLIKHVCRQAKITTTKAVTSLPAFSVFSSILNLPTMSKKDLASAVKWEAKKVIPMPLEEMILDWKVVEEISADGTTKSVDSVAGAVEAKAEVQENGNGNAEEYQKKGFLKISPWAKKKYTKILLTAAPKDLVKRYISIFKTAGLNLLSLDTESFALIRSLVGNDKSSVMIVDIGSVVTNISVVVNSIPILNRSIDVGGLSIT
ncbi:MAG: hypothetical protein CMI53_04540, partial [Parcubacteria group bacterium]|nr:hypothetical protein [Parcubacteria group bacterium]